MGQLWTSVHRAWTEGTIPLALLKETVPTIPETVTSSIAYTILDFRGYSPIA